MISLLPQFYNEYQFHFAQNFYAFLSTIFSIAKLYDTFQIGTFEFLVSCKLKNTFFM